MKITIIGMGNAVERTLESLELGNYSVKEILYILKIKI